MWGMFSESRGKHRGEVERGRLALGQNLEAFDFVQKAERSLVRSSARKLMFVLGTEHQALGEQA